LAHAYARAPPAPPPATFSSICCPLGKYITLGDFESASAMSFAASLKAKSLFVSTPQSGSLPSLINSDGEAVHVAEATKKVMKETAAPLTEAVAVAPTAGSIVMDAIVPPKKAARKHSHLEVLLQAAAQTAAEKAAHKVAHRGHKAAKSAAGHAAKVAAKNAVLAEVRKAAALAATRAKDESKDKDLKTQTKAASLAASLAAKKVLAAAKRVVDRVAKMAAKKALTAISSSQTHQNPKASNGVSFTELMSSSNGMAGTQTLQKSR